MPSRFEQVINTLTRSDGYNNVNDASPGMSVSSGTGAQKISQLGNRLVLGPDEIIYDTDIGTLYGGVYQYVRFRSADVTAAARGLIYLWDTTVDEDLYQVSNLETIGGTAGSQTCSFRAGICLNAVTAAYYGWIQVAGKASVDFRAVLTGVAADGCSVYQAGAGAGADNATADVLDGVGANPTFDQVAQMQRRYLGQAEGIPTAGAISVINNMPLLLRV